MTLKICVAQLDFVVGDLVGNAQKMIDAAKTAHAQGARLMLTPELSIFKWFKEDFEKGDRGVRRLEELLARYADQLSDAPPERERLRAAMVSITYLDYDWLLNDAAR